MFGLRPALATVVPEHKARRLSRFDLLLRTVDTMTRQQDPFPPYIELDQVAEYLKVSVDSLKRRSDLPVRKLAHGRWAILESEWMEYLEGTRVAEETTSSGVPIFREPA